MGYRYTENLGNGARLDYFDNDHGFSAGIGIEYDLSDKQGDFLKNVTYDRVFDGHADQGRGWSLFLDYQRLLVKSDYLIWTQSLLVLDMTFSCVYVHRR